MKQQNKDYKSSQVLSAQQANEMKSKVKKFMRTVDQNKNDRFSGKISTHLFFDVLSLHGIQLSLKDQGILSKSYGTDYKTNSSFKTFDNRNSKISYKDALAMIFIDLDSENPF